jgi:hypothetical protein
MAHFGKHDHIDHHVRLECHGTFDASKKPLLPHDVLPVRFWRHLVQRFWCSHHAIVLFQSHLVLQGPGAVSFASHWLSQRVVRFIEFNRANKLQTTISSNQAFLAIRSVRCFVVVHHGASHLATHLA